MISVVMPVYREKPEMVRQSVDSMLTQTYSDFELLIILDDPMNNELIHLIQSYEDSRIRFLINPENMKVANSLNRAIRHASGDIIVQIDADDISEPDRLDKELQYMKNGDFDFIGSLTRVVDDAGSPLFEVRHLPDTPEKISKALRYGQSLAHSTWMVKKSVFDELDGYRMIPLCEDYDFTLRAALAGYKLGCLNEPLVKYRMSEGSQSRTNLFRQYLYMLYLSSNYRKKQAVNVEEANDWVNKHFDENLAEAYYESNSLFNRAMSCLQNKNWLSFFSESFRLLFTSGHYLEKIYRSFRITALS